MTNGNGSAKKLPGTVEIHGTHLEGKRPGARARGGKGKRPAIGMVQRGENPDMKPLSDLSKESVLKIMKARVWPELFAIHTDEFRSYKRGLKAYPAKLHRICHATEWLDGEIHTNAPDGASSLLKRSIVGSYQKVGLKHHPAYIE